MVLAPAAGSQHHSPSPRSPLSITLVALRWLARLTGALLVLLLGTFFIEHVGEWYSQPSRALPPWWVHFSMLSHFALMAGLLMLLGWERLGSLVAVLGALGFLAAIAIGQNTLRLPYIVLVALVPVGIIGVRHLLLRRSARR
ncbi:MAG TPA: hypothetical protein PKE29_08905 [Phycisphaerales bacterium]|nr:hypothetical protein [Phycisphaerales bacterium]